MAPVTYGPLDEEQATSAAIASSMKKLEAVDCLVGRARLGVQAAEQYIRAAKDAVTAAQQVLLLEQQRLEACESLLFSAREDLDAAQYLRASLLEAIQQDRSVLSDLLLLSTRHSKLTGTVNRLPSDILYCIFDFIDDPGPQHPRWNRSIVLSHVSRHWRYVAISTPFLWTTIDFRFGSYFARLFGRRSRDYPLHIVIQPLPGDTVDPAAYYEVEKTSPVRHLWMFVVSILEYAERWSSFTLSAHHASIPGLVLRWISKNFDSRQVKGITLDEISLSGPDVCYQIIQDLNVQFLNLSDVEKAPFSACRLVIQRLSISHVGFFSSVVVSLELRDLSYRHIQLLPMLERCPNLSELVVMSNTQFCPLEDDTVKNICTLPRLRDLTLSDPLCLQFMRMPSLHKLHVYNTTPCGISLSLLGVLLGHSPVGELAIFYKEFPDKFYHSLPGFCRDSRPLFPLLRSLSLDYTFIRNEDLLSIVEFPELLKLRLHLEQFVMLECLQQILQKRTSNESITSLERLEVVSCSQIMDDDRYVLEKQVTELVLFADDDPTDEDYDPELDLESESDTDSEIDAVIDESEVEYLHASENVSYPP